MRRAASRLIAAAEGFWGQEACGIVSAEDAMLLLLRLRANTALVAQLLAVKPAVVRKWRRNYRGWRRLVKLSTSRS